MMNPVFPSDNAEILFFRILALWILSEIVGTVIIPRLRRGGAVIDKKDRGSNLLILMTILFSIGLAIILPPKALPCYLNGSFIQGLF